MSNDPARRRSTRSVPSRESVLPPSRMDYRVAVTIRPLAGRLLVSRWLLGAVAILACFNGGGCVKRRLTVRSNPPGARVLIDDQEIGVTPVSTSFTYYANRKIQLIKDGFEPLTVLSPFSAPWYEIPPLDLFSENFAGREIRDERAVEFQLVPQQLVPEEVLLGRAEQLRGQARQGYTVPLMSPPPSPPPSPSPLP